MILVDIHLTLDTLKRSRGYHHLRQRGQLLPAVVDTQGEVFFGNVGCKDLHTAIISWAFVGLQRQNSDKNDKGPAALFS